MRDTSDNQPWIRSKPWDTSLILFGWVPFFIWCIGWLDLGGKLGRPLDLADLKLAIIVSVVCQLTHRNYTFLVVYLDKQTFLERSLLFVLTPLVAVLLGTYVLWFGSPIEFIIGSVFMLLWQAYHTVMQRFGLLRAYHRKQGHSQQLLKNGKRIDLWFMWSLMVFTFFASSYWNQELLQFQDIGQKVNTFILWLGPWPLFLIIACGLVFLFSLVRLVYFEKQISKDLPLAIRAPRLTFIASTFILCVTAFTHGPIIFFLSFAFLHALEYIAFIHHYSHKKYLLTDNQSIAAKLFRKPIPSAILILGIQIPFFYWLDQISQGDVFKFYLLFNVLFGIMHFTYDGVIWKMRSKKVQKVLGMPAERGSI
ncbi:hypothetical protein ACFL17_08230 [Pseudomonadota bacterium]